MKGYFSDPSGPAQGTPFTRTQPHGLMAHRLPTAMFPSRAYWVSRRLVAGLSGGVQTQADPGEPGPACSGMGRWQPLGVPTRARAQAQDNRLSATDTQ